MKKIRCLLAAIPFALSIATMPAAYADGFVPNFPVPAALRDPAPEVVPETTLTTLQGPAIDENYAFGTAACFAGIIDNDLIVAGGTNMTGNKVSFEADKRYYKDIYTATLNNNTLQWKKAGELPEELAYGVSVTVADGIICAGGLNETTGTSNKVYKLSKANGNINVANLPDLPVTLSHMGGCVINNVLYLAGGVANDVATNAVYALDLSKDNAAWSIASYYPGSARIQPICTSDGNDLFIWGGYSSNAIISLDGYKYQPAANSWSAVATPKLADGVQSTRIYTGNAAAVYAGNNRVVVTGGTSPEILAQNMEKIAGDYLQHNNDWYKYNKYVMIYRTDTNSWLVPAQTSQTARVDAVNVYHNNKIYCIGGEIAPGVCTNEIAVINVK